MKPILFTLFIFTVHFINYFWRPAAGSTKKRVAKKSNLPPIPTEVMRKILEEHKEYYNELAINHQNEFKSRVAYFLKTKRFFWRARDGREITDEMRVLIAAAAVKLTFGFPKLAFLHFNTILVYPHDYYSRITRKYHLGEVNPRGFIVLSWRHFLHGMQDTNDGRHLGLHEMAHALMLENGIRNGEYNFLSRKWLRALDREAEREMRKIRNGQVDFFRRYAGVNAHEFFAVAVENYFERPAQFKLYNPKLYNIMRHLLLQDPLRLHPAKAKEKKAPTN